MEAEKAAPNSRQRPGVRQPSGAFEPVLEPTAAVTIIRTPFIIKSRRGLALFPRYGATDFNPGPLK